MWDKNSLEKFNKWKKLFQINSINYLELKYLITAYTNKINEMKRKARKILSKGFSKKVAKRPITIEININFFGVASLKKLTILFIYFI